MVEATKQKKPVIVDLVKKYQRKEVDDLLRRKFFVVPSFEIYSGMSVSGFFDFGPLGSALKLNVEALWRQHFVLEEDMLELTTTNITVDQVFMTSGHVDKFQDIMVKDMKTGTPRRADKIIAEHLQKILPKKKNAEEIAKLERILLDVEQYNCEQLDAVITELAIRDPDTGNEFSPSLPFNLMFSMPIGPAGGATGYLRPETAQGIFINFRRLLEFNNGRMPFAAAQIGQGFRNEISPRQGLLRVREFTMGEIEHFYDPKNTKHPKISHVENLRLPLYSAKDQDDGLKDANCEMSVREALDSGVLKSETLAYFMSRTFQFFIKCGIQAAGIRFRQHRAKEQAHYSNDCWDAEVETSYGWIEVAGHSDRSAFDLTLHQNRTRVELMAARQLPEKITYTQILAQLDKKILGKEFKKDGNVIAKSFEDFDQDKLKQLQETLATDGKISVEIAGGKVFELLPQHVTFIGQEKTTQEEKYIPHVIEPSYGIGRILACIFEHCFKVREADAQRTYFDFPPQIAPVKCSLLPLQNSPELNAKVTLIKRILIDGGVTFKVDDSGQSVGKRYARTDECGIPFALTIDFDTLKDDTVTMRDLFTMKQVRLPIAEVSVTIRKLSAAQMTWQETVDQYGLVGAAAAEESKE